MEWQGAPLVHPEAAGGCEARERDERVGSSWVGQGGGGHGVVGQVLGGDEISSGRPKSAFVFDFLFAFWRLVGDTGWFSA
jgi:hypothetical protein